jgi:hypothetical protein
MDGTFHDTRLRTLIRLIALGVPGVQFAVLAAALLHPSMPIDRFLRDPSSLSEKYVDCCKFYDGAISHLGVLG